MNETDTVCSTEGVAGHRDEWILRPFPSAGGEVYSLYCPKCNVRVGSIRSADRGAGRKGNRRTGTPETRCKSCGRDLPKLPSPMPQPEYCAFCKRMQG